MARADNATFFDKNWVERFRQPVSTFSRVMWYLRPRIINCQEFKWWDIVTDKNRDLPAFKFWYNAGKRSEFADRKWFTFWHICQREQSLIEDNKKFKEKYA